MINLNALVVNCFNRDLLISEIAHKAMMRIKMNLQKLQWLQPTV